MSDLIERLTAAYATSAERRDAEIEAAAELSRLTADNAALRADAERYRFLRDGEYSESLLDLLVRPNTHKVAVDTAIDSARAKESDNS